MDFAEWIREQATKTYTENGAAARNTTGDARLDLFATIGSLRRADPERIELLFAEAYQADPLFALKILFYARDIREGLGERRVFRILLQYLAEYHPQVVIANLDLIGVFGRFDDWYCLIGTGVEDEMWSAMKQQLEADLKNFQEGKSVSLLAKWIKTADSKNTETRKLGILTAQKLGYPVYNFKRIVRSLRKYIGVLEVKMSEGKWEEIVYPEVSGRAMMIYRNAFRKHDEKRFNQYLAKALDGKEKIHAETLYPYDLVEKVLYGRQWNQVLEAAAGLCGAGNECNCHCRCFGFHEWKTLGDIHWSCYLLCRAEPGRLPQSFHDVQPEAGICFSERGNPAAENQIRRAYGMGDEY